MCYKLVIVSGPSNMNATAYRRWSTATIVLLTFTLGLPNSLFGPTLLDLMLIFNATYQDISSAVAIRGIGVMIGALGAGFLVDAFDNYKLHVTAVAQIICVICVTVIPWLPSVSLVWVAFALLGISNGMMQIGTTRTLLHLWQQQTPQVLALPQIASSVGGLLAPLLATPFLATWEAEDIADKRKECSVHLRQHQTASPIALVPVTPSMVQYAYVFAGALVAIVTVPFLLVHFFSGWRSLATPYEDLTERLGILKALNPGTYANGSKLYGSFVIYLSSIYAFNVVGMLFVYVTFISAFVVEFYHEGKHVASLIVTFFYIASIIGSLLASLLTRMFHVKTVFTLYNAVNCTSGLLLIFFYKSTMLALWISTFLFGCCLNPLYGLLPGMVNTQIEAKGLILACIVLSRGFGDLSYVWLTGYQFDMYGPSTVPYLSFVISAATLLYGLLFVMISVKHGDRF